MKYGFVLPKGNARTAAEVAQLAEESGWDGFFVWEPVWGVDAWVCLTAAAMVTTTIKLGTMLTPLSRMRPWKLASETATLDNLSDGRVILAVGLGAVDSGFAEFGEETDRKLRAERLDEGLDIVTGLWAGQPFEYAGKHYTIRPTEFMPPDPPVQQPRIPIWVVGAWGRQKSMARALRYDGLLPAVGYPQDLSPELLTEIRQFCAEQRGPAAGPYDIVVEGATPVGDEAAREHARALAGRRGGLVDRGHVGRRGRRLAHAGTRARCRRTAAVAAQADRGMNHSVKSVAVPSGPRRSTHRFE